MDYRLQSIEKPGDPTGKSGLRPAIAVQGLDMCVLRARTPKGYGRMFLAVRKAIFIALFCAPVFAVDPLEQRALDIASANNHAELRPEHLVAAALEKVAAEGTLKIDSAAFTQVQNALMKKMESIPKRGRSSEMTRGRDVEKFILSAKKHADSLESRTTLPAHVLMAAVESTSPVHSEVQQLGLTLDSIRKQIDPKQMTKHADPVAAQDEILSKYATDLVELARKGEITRPYGRDKEIDQAIVALGRKYKNNAAVLGEPGVGKTAIVEGIAFRILDGTVPEFLKGKSLLALNQDAFVAGTKFRGEFEERMGEFTKAFDARGNAVLFIDEFHQFVTLGATGEEGANGAGNSLKPRWSRGQLPTIIATTEAEWDKHVAKDGALERRFERVVAAPPDNEGTLAILRDARKGFQEHHGVEFEDSAEEKALELSNKYYGGFQPDKGLSLLDSAGSAFKIARENGKQGVLKPIELELKKLRAMQTSLLNKPSNEIVEKKLSDLDGRIETLEKRHKTLSDAYDAGESALRELAGTLPGVPKATGARRAKLEAQLDEIRKLHGLHHDKVNAYTVASVVAAQKGVPLGNLAQSEADRVSKVEDTIKQKLVGQEGPRKGVVKGIRRFNAGMQKPGQPIAYLMTGASGSGKTLFANILNDFWTGGSVPILKINGGNYKTSHSVEALKGGTVGYVGADDEGILMGPVRRRPRGVILVDEADKAYDDHGNPNHAFFDLWLPILDDGKGMDSKGRTVNFSDWLIIFTANWARETASNKAIPFEERQRLTQQEILATGIRPEWLNRFGLTSILPFAPLSDEEIRNVLKLEIDKIQAGPLDERGIALRVDEAARNKLIELGFDPVGGARGLEEGLKHFVRDPVGEMQLEYHDAVAKTGVIEVSLSEDGEKFRYSVPEKAQKPPEGTCWKALAEMAVRAKPIVVPASN